MIYTSKFTSRLEDAANWADRRGVDYAIYRDAGDWTVQINLRDANGSFLAFYTIPDTRGNVDVPKVLDALCIKARKERINGGKPAYGRA